MHLPVYIISWSSLYLILLSWLPHQCLPATEVAYSFQYGVEAVGVITHHREDRRGDIVHGSYSFLEPDGRVRVVEYQVAGNKGFNAAVSFRSKEDRSIGYLTGHLTFPKYYTKPIFLKTPVSFITEDLFKGSSSYPNLS